MSLRQSLGIRAGETRPQNRVVFDLDKGNTEPKTTSLRQAETPAQRGGNAGERLLSLNRSNVICSTP